jgi:hypothetical protein
VCINVVMPNLYASRAPTDAPPLGHGRETHPEVVSSLLTAEASDGSAVKVLK